MATAYVEVQIDGQAIYEFSKDALLEQVDVIQEINRHWWCYARCRQTEDRRFPVEEALGKDLQVIVHDEQQNDTYLFSGIVLEAELEYEIYGSYTARITGVSKTYNMDVAPRQKYYELHTPLSQIADDTTGRAGLSASGDKGGGEFNFPMPLVQWGETDFNFLVRSADDMWRFIAPNPETADQVDFIYRNEWPDGPTLKWRTEDELISFKLKGRLRSSKMDGSHYNWEEGLSQDFTDMTGDANFFGGAGQMVSKMKEQSADKIKTGYVVDRRGRKVVQTFGVLLQMEAYRSQAAGVVGYGVSLKPAVVAGKTVTIEGLDNAEGKYGVKKVAHHWTSAGYTNEFWCTASGDNVEDTRPKSNRWNGVVIGRVADNNDPEQMGRIKVQYIWQEDGPSYWARMMTPHAGHDRGFFFLPEIGDEVVVAFEDGDPERPIILGCLWNKPDTPPVEDFWGGEYASDDVKRIVTKSGHRIQLVDKDGKESIVIATPTHIKVAMIENTDENGRATLLLHSDGDIVLNAGGRIHCKSSFFSREVG